MKIVRFVTENGDISLGAIDENRPGKALVLEGDLLGKLEKTNRYAVISRLLAPLDPPNILAVGLNYGRHAEETKVSRPEIPVLFIKATTSVIGPGETIILPAAGPE